MTTTATIEHDGRTYVATIDQEDEVRIDCDGVWAGDGSWDSLGGIYDCPADLPEGVYEALDAALHAVIVAEAQERGAVEDALHHGRSVRRAIEEA